MSFFNVILEDEDFVVLGPPNQIDVSVNVGKEGPRGSRFFVGYGDPNLPDVVPSGEIPQIGDVFINGSTAGRYGWLYIYSRTPASSATSANQWVPALRLQPSIYVRNSLVIFSAGTAVISIPISNITPDFIVADIEKYIINITPQHPNPISFSITNKEIIGANVVFTVKAVEYASLAWSDLSGTVLLGINISVV
jgi:hypothetical protein